MLTPNPKDHPRHSAFARLKAFIAAGLERNSTALAASGGLFAPYVPWAEDHPPTDPPSEDEVLDSER